MKSLIVKDKKIMGGVPVIKNTRIPISSIIYLLARGKTLEEITTRYYPCLEKETLIMALNEHAKEIKVYNK